MGATSVTGVSGVGSAAKPGRGNKGSEHMSLGVHRLIGPRVVAAGTVTLVRGGPDMAIKIKEKYPNAHLPKDAPSGFALVDIPPLVGGYGRYSLQLTPAADLSGEPASGVFLADNVFLVYGAATVVVHWAVIKNGIWGSPTTPLAYS
jgi:hypothetical protein